MTNGIRGPMPMIETHPLKEEMEECIAEGMTPRTILAMLKWRHGPELDRFPPLPSVRTLYRWIEARTPSDSVIPKSWHEQRVIAKKLEKIDVQIDVLQSLHNLYAITEDRAVKAIAAEEATAQAMQGLAGEVVLMPQTDKALQSAREMLDSIWRVGQDLGLYPRPARPTMTMAMSKAGALLTVGEEPNYGELQTVMEALYRLRTGSEPPDLPDFIEGNEAP